MIYRELGSTGFKTSIIGLGGWHIGLKKVDEALSIKLMHAAIEGGINFFDNSWDYNEGISEIRMGKALKNGLREKVFLMTKIDGRTKKEAAKQLDQSLERMDVDCIDLVQHHEMLRFEDPHRIFGEEGANEALLEAKKAGKIRFIGFTGHKDPQIHLHVLAVAKEHDFRFDAVQMPLNVMDAHYRSFAKLVVPELVKEKIAVLGMKSMANGVVLNSKTATPIECLHYAMNLPTSVVIAGLDSMPVLEQALEAVRTFKPMTDEVVAQLLEKTKKAGSDGAFEPFKTSSIFDGTAINPQWLGEEPEKIQALMND
ncbi:MAG: aldo/keto reductase [Candidatus Obscuribacterales bacterium]|nr:aldo/keto reductase [Candidatus Obscuribacterales bacterium]